MSLAPSARCCPKAHAMTRIRLGALWTAVAVSLTLMVGCGSTHTTDIGRSPTTAKTKLLGQISVSAAASLADAFTRLGKDFQQANPGTSVAFSFDSSSTLAAQIIERAPADLYASADMTNMEKLVDQGLVTGKPRVFARNTLVIVTKPGNPKKITSLRDLRSVGVVSLCGKTVPCGLLAGSILNRLGVTISESSVSRGQDARATLTAVAAGDAVAGIVYATDAKGAGKAVTTVTIPPNENAGTAYPICLLNPAGSKAVDHGAAGRRREVAGAFMAYVLSDVGRATLQEFGFLPP